MKIITISGKAKHGKDCTATLIKKQLEEKRNKVLVTHFADLLKYICKTFFDWDGKKNKEGRSILQYVGTDIIRKQNPDYWVDFIISILSMFGNTWDYIIIPDTRFINENDKLKEVFDVIAVRVWRPHYNNGLTEEQQKHESETALDNYKFDYYIINNGDNTIIDRVDRFIEWLNKGVT